MKKAVVLQLLLLPLLFSVAKAEDLVNDANYKARCKVCHGPNGEGNLK